MRSLLKLIAGFLATSGLLLTACNHEMPQDNPRTETMQQHDTVAVSPGVVEGTVVSYADGTLVLADPQGKESRFKVGKAVDVSVSDKGVAVNVGGRQLRGEDLKKGLHVQVNTNKDGDVVSIHPRDEVK